MKIAEALQRVAKEAGWPVQEWNGTFKFDVDSKNGTWKLFCKPLDEENRFCCYSLCPVNAPKERIPWMAQVLTRLNYGLKVGNFEMDWTSGEIHFKTYVDFCGGEDPVPAVGQCIYANMVSFDAYFQTLMQALQAEEGNEDFLKKL